VRRATFVLAVVVGLAWLAGCNDLRDFAGEWRGERVGDLPAFQAGEGDRAVLVIEDIDKHGLRGRLTVEAGSLRPISDAPIVSLEPAEADALATMTFAGAPMRVYLAFAPVGDGAGDALAIIALYDSRRIELRLLRGSPSPIYAIFKLGEG
jgi:hypothetical protein